MLSVTSLLFTHHYPARCFGINMPKSRDIQAKMPSPKVILNAFLLVTVKVLNSYLQLMKNRTAMICVMEERRILQWKKHRDHVKG